MTPQPPTRDEPLLTPDQIRAQFWADSRQRVCAVAMGSRLPGLRERLASADVADYDCLVPGALSASEQAKAAYLIELLERSAFTDWLLFEAPLSLGEWGTVTVTEAPRLTLRAHLRSLRECLLPDGQRIELDWMDPEVLALLLPLFGRAELQDFMGPMRGLAIPRGDGWSMARIVAGQLQWRHARVAPSA